VSLAFGQFAIVLEAMAALGCPAFVVVFGQDAQFCAVDATFLGHLLFEFEF
jgi:hypothetical protein